MNPLIDVAALTHFHDAALADAGWSEPAHLALQLESTQPEAGDIEAQVFAGKEPDIREPDVRWLASSASGQPGTDSWLRHATANHHYNTLLWHTEDQARRPDVPPAFIMRCKRRIDCLNQLRNDAVEALDEALLCMLGQPSAKGRQHSETPDAMIDRLSILALKIFHMQWQVRRADAEPAHRLACEAKLQRLLLQRSDLVRCLEMLIDDVIEGRAWFRQYRQFKMYNDPALNPWLGGQANG